MWQLLPCGACGAYERVGRMEAGLPPFPLFGYGGWACRVIKLSRTPINHPSPNTTGSGNGSTPINHPSRNTTGSRNGSTLISHQSSVITKPYSLLTAHYALRTSHYALLTERGE